jgi:hypothetical protein
MELESLNNTVFWGELVANIVSIHKKTTLRRAWSQNSVAFKIAPLRDTPETTSVFHDLTVARLTRGQQAKQGATPTA